MTEPVRWLQANLPEPATVTLLALGGLGCVKYAENPPKKYQDIYPLYFDADASGGAILDLHVHDADFVRQSDLVFQENLAQLRGELDRFAKVKRGLLYLGTEHGIYVSFDNGGRPGTRSAISGTSAASSARLPTCWRKICRTPMTSPKPSSVTPRRRCPKRPKRCSRS